MAEELTQPVALERIEALRREVNIRFDAIEKAVTKAEGAADRRFESVNEFRGQLNDQTRTLLPRPEADTKFRAQDDKIEALTKTITALQTSQANQQGRASVIAAVVSIAASALVSILVRMFQR